MRARVLILVLVAIALIQAPVAEVPASAGRTPSGKKVIEWGWDEPDTRFMRENIARMEQLPFDGLVFHVNSSKGGNLAWEAWSKRRFVLEEFKQAVEELRATRFRRFTDRFLRVNVTPGTVDWYDDAEWATVLNNFGLAAQIARQRDCKGFMFDVEQYEGKLFDFRQQRPRGGKDFADYRRQVRRRGRSWMQEVNRRFPDITILLTFGYAIAQPHGKGDDRSSAPYGLLADFLDGLLDACSKDTVIVDACESSYAYKRPSEFRRAYATIREQALSWTANPGQYRKHVQAGFGLWMDNDWSKKGWNVADFSGNHFTPGEFQAALHAAIATSDEYVWVYTEQPRWWTGENLPQAYVEALKGR
jgi:hypothetical protein